MSNTWMSTETEDSNFPSVAMTRSVYLSLDSLSRGSFEIKPHKPSPCWMMANWPKASPSENVVYKWVNRAQTYLESRIKIHPKIHLRTGNRAPSCASSANRYGTVAQQINIILHSRAHLTISCRWPSWNMRSLNVSLLNTAVTQLYYGSKLR